MPASNETAVPLDPKTVLPVFGQLDNSIRLLTSRIDAMLARDPKKEFENSEGNVGSDYQKNSYSRCESFRLPILPAVPFFNKEFVASIYPKLIRLRVKGLWQFGGDLANITIVQHYSGVMLEFFKDLRGNGAGMGGTPDATLYFPWQRITGIETTTVVATGVHQGTTMAEIDDRIPLTFRYLKASLFNGYNAGTGIPIKFTGNATSIVGTVGNFYLDFLGD